MRRFHPTTLLATLLGLDIAMLLLAVALTPHQNPALPIELSVVLALVITWLSVRRSRPAIASAGIFSAALLALTAHILAGDLGVKGPSEIVPDILVLIVTAAAFGVAARALWLGRRPANA